MGSQGWQRKNIVWWSHAAPCCGRERMRSCQEPRTSYLDAHLVGQSAGVRLPLGPFEQTFSNIDLLETVKNKLRSK
jgi:hypothetical protein